MKIGIVTIVDYTNYGNRLQNYAVYHILRKKFGHKANSLVAFEDKPFYNGSYIAWLKDQIVRLTCILPSFAEKRFGNTVTRWANFRNWSRHIPTKNCYNHKYLPKELNGKYDLFLAGSDQIWNYHFSSRKFEDYFLRFAEDGKKAAISASFGVDELPEEWKETFSNDLKSFAHISVREDAGAKIVKDLIGRDVPVLIDPVMMLTKEEWIRVAKKPRVDTKKPYILKYYLGDEAEANKLDAWAKANGFEVYELLNDKIPELYSAGPGEFISLIQNAALVCSDSFHCIAFSILFERPFVVYSRLGTGNYMTSRLHTLLGKFKLENRWKHLLSEEDYLSCDYSQLESLLAKEREAFSNYLKNVLKKD